MLRFFKRIAYFIPRWSDDPYSKNTGWLIFNFLKQKKLIFNFFVNRNWKRAKILADNRKSHHPIETLILENKQIITTLTTLTLNL